MLIKTLKYDFVFSRAWFLIAAALMIVLSAILRLNAQPSRDIGGTGGTAEIVLPMVLMVTGIISIFQILIFVNKTLFEETGYLTLTLPVKRLTLLTSKLIVSVVWFNFMLLAAAISVILFDSQRTSFNFMRLSRSISLENFIALVEVNFVAIFLILVISFSTVLAHSSLWRRHFHGLAVVAGLACVGLFYLLFDVIWSRQMEQAPVTTELSPVIGANIGRIPIGGDGGFIDIYSFGALFLLCALMLWATNYLLKRRVCI